MSYPVRKNYTETLEAEESSPGLHTFKPVASLPWSFPDTVAMGALRLLCVCHYGVATDSLTNEVDPDDKFPICYLHTRYLRHSSYSYKMEQPVAGNNSIMHSCISFTSFDISIPLCLISAPCNHCPEYLTLIKTFLLGSVCLGNKVNDPR